MTDRDAAHWNDNVDERSLFIAAMQIDDAAERSAYLDHACGEDVELHQRLQALLDAHVQAGSFLVAPAITTNLAATIDQPIVERLGALIGRYKLLEQIGEGGFGIVFMAEQQEPVRRKVALKVLKPGMDTRQVVARFEAERQALALMDHPNIAHVFDGGTTEAGRPYFVMDLVKGVPITAYCDQNQIAPCERLELFVQVCEAVQHAHQKGIIHRDIKPSNVLISRHDGTPAVKVIDFGIAKALGQQLTEKTLFTNFAQLIGTPLYMSPEQAGMSDLDVDTRSDIYSLGVLLYELLTGATPFDARRFKDAGFDEMRRIIREEEPPKPSARISTVGRAAETVSANRQSDPKQLSRLFRGELDWIVMKALEKDRDRRYETANGLAMDVKRYLRDEPVLACPPSAWYRLSKFARRKKAALAMAACVLVAFSGIAGGVGWAVRDKSARDEAIEFDRLAREKALDLAVERSLDETGPLIEDGKWPEAIVVLDRVEQLLAAAGRTERPSRMSELRSALHVARQLEGIYRGTMPDAKPQALAPNRNAANYENPTGDDAYDEAFFWGRRQDAEFSKAFLNLGIDVETLPPGKAADQIRRQKIRTALVRALDGWATFRKRSQGALRWRGDAGSDWKKLVEIARQVDSDDLRNRCRDALLQEDRQTLEKLADAIPVRNTSPESLYLVGHALKEVGAVDLAMNFLERARREYPGELWINDALADFSSSACSPPRWDDALRYSTVVLALRPDFSPIHLRVADALKAKGAANEALLEYSKAIELEPKSVIVWTIRGSYYRSLARYREAVADYSQAIELEPTNVSAWQSRSSVFLEAGQLDQALVDATRAVKTVRERLEVGSGEPNVRVDLGHSLWHLARVLSSASKKEETEQALHEALNVFEDLASGYPQERYYRMETAYTLRQLFFDIWRHANRAGEAVEGMRRAIDLYAALAAEEPHDSFYRSEFAVTCYDLANYLQAQQRASEAEQYFQQALDARRTLVVESPTSERRFELAQAHHALATLYRDAQRPGEAEEAFGAALEIYRKLLSEAAFPGAVPWSLGDACCDLAGILRTTGRAQEADELCRQVAQECRSALSVQKQLVHARNLPGDRFDLAATLESLARLLNELDEAQEVERCYRDAIGIRQQLVAESNSGDHRFFLGVNYNRLGGFLKQRGQTDEAADAYRSSRTILEQLVSELNQEDRRKHLAWAYEALGELAEAANRIDDAAAAYRMAAEVWQKLAADFTQSSEYREKSAKTVRIIANLYGNHGRLAESLDLLDKAVEKWPLQAALWQLRGEQLARLGLFSEAAADFIRADELGNPRESLGCVQHALLRAYIGDTAGYRDVCRPMLARFADSAEPEDWNHIAQTFTIFPDWQPDPSRTVGLAERAVAHDKSAWRVAFLGMALFRAREFPRAATTLEESLAINAGWNPPLVHSALAMAWQRLGNSEQAAAALASAASARDQRIESMLAGGLGQWPCLWYDALYGELLFKEAYALIRSSPPPDDPRWLVLRGRGLETVGRADEARAAIDQAFAIAPADLLLRIQALPDISREEDYAQALAAIRGVLKEHPRQPPAARLALASRLLGWGERQERERRAQAAAEAFADAAAGYQDVLTEIESHPESAMSLGVPATADNIAWYRHELGYALVWYGSLLSQLGQLPEAEAALCRGLAVHKILVADRPDQGNFIARLAWNLLNLGNVCKARGDRVGAELAYRDSVSLAEETEFYHEDLVNACEALADLCQEDGRVVEAVEARRKAVAAREKRVAKTNESGQRRRLADEHRRLARLLVQSRNNPEAIAAYCKAREYWEVLVREQPDSADCFQFLCETQSELSEALVSAGRSDEALEPLLTIADLAEKRLHDSVEHWRGVRGIHKGLAKFYFTAGRIQEGLKAYDLAIEQRPQEHAVWGRRGEFYLRLGLWDRAAHDIAMDCRLGPPVNPHQWLAHALLSLQSGDLAAYQDVCRRLPEFFKTSADCAGLDNELVRACSIVETPDADLAWALRISESAVERSPHAAWEQFALGLARYRSGDFEGAVAALNKSTAWQSGCLSHPALALAYHRLGREQEAREALDRATEAINRLADEHLWTPVGTMPMFPHDWLSALLLYREAVTIIEGRAPPEDFRQIAAQGRSLAALGEAKAADEACRRALELGAENFQVCLACSMILAELGQPSAAESALAAAARLKPASAQDLYALAFAAGKLGKQSEAIVACAKGVEVEPTDALEHNNLAWLYATCPSVELRDPAKAVALAKKAVELKLTDGSGWNTLGAANYRFGDWPAAMEALNKSMELRKGGDAFDWFFLAMAHWQLGDQEQALKWYEQAVDWMDKNQSNDEELRRFRAEAAALLDRGEK